MDEIDYSVREWLNHDMGAQMEAKGWIDADKTPPKSGMRIRLSDGRGNVLADVGMWGTKEGQHGLIYTYMGNLDGGPKQWWKPA